METKYSHNYSNSLQGFKRDMFNIELNKLEEYVQILQEQGDWDRFKIANNVLKHRYGKIVEKKN